MVIVTKTLTDIPRVTEPVPASIYYKGSRSKTNPNQLKVLILRSRGRFPRASPSQIREHWCEDSSDESQAKAKGLDVTLSTFYWALLDCNREFHIRFVMAWGMAGKFQRTCRRGFCKGKIQCSSYTRL